MEFVQDRKGLAIDAGSNVGFWAWHLAREFDSVQCFEPVPRHNECLSLNCRGVGNISIHEEALGNKTGEVELLVADGNCGATHINQDCSQGGEAFTKVAAKCCTLDHYGFKNVRFLKIDCEGFELPVLQGAERLLQENSPVIVVEQKKENERPGLPAKGAVKYLESFGYVVKQVLAGDYIMAKGDKNGR
jgi:FkbM family methyltransferase